jgi:putative colanic acid biosynthesis acetyltransferase WcaF
VRFLWYFVEATFFRYSPRPFYRWRNFLLRLFGANVHKSCRIRSSVKIEVPWHLTVGAETIIGDDVILYCLGPVTIGERVTISQLAHLCAGTHDFTRRDFPLLRPPIVISNDVWIAADVFVGPGVTVGAGAVVGARSSVFHDLPEWHICVGNPAKPIKRRIMVDDVPPADGDINASSDANKI